MKKMFILFILCVLLTGCSVNYTLDFDENDIKEKIVLEFDENIKEVAKNSEGDGFYIEKELVDNRIPALTNSKRFYEKTLDINDKKSIVSLNYTYNYENLIDSYIINKCFEKTIFANEDESYSFELSGAFTCLEKNDILVKISSKYKVISNNANYYKDGYYVWKLKKSNETQNIRLIISKTKLSIEKNKSQFKGFKIISLIVIIIGCCTYFIIKRKINHDTF